MGTLLLIVCAGIITLLVLILVIRIPAFIALLISSILVGLLAGLDSVAVIDTIKNGMGSTLGFVATVVGLGSLFGGILEVSGGANAIARQLLKSFGEKRSATALSLTGFIVAIPVFFDVAFIILVPVVYALQKNSKKSLLHFAIPLLTGLAITHTFIPPTPGPVAVGEILNVDLGWIMLAGVLAGIPTMVVSGVLYGKYIAGKEFVSAPEDGIEELPQDSLPPFSLVFMLIAIPILLIVLSTFTSEGHFPFLSENVKSIISLIGHPFTALIIANLLAWYILGIGRGFTSDQLLKVSTKSLQPAGIIILLTGAGGVFKQVLVDTGAGTAIATALSDIGMPVLVFAFLAACLIRIIQGSATVAMITAAGLVFPFVESSTYSGLQMGAIVIAIGSGATIFSHVNDSGFWLVKEYLGMTEQQTLKTWTSTTVVLALTGFVCSSIIFMIA